MIKQTRRNSNRTGSRNAKGMQDLLAQDSSLVTTGFYYQYCPARGCRQIEAAIAEGDQDNFTDGIQATLIANGAAAMKVVHTAEDVKQELPITLHSRGMDGNSVVKSMSWDDLSDILLYVHESHAKASPFKGCANFDRTHLGYARDSADDADLSLSNVLRDVPGVRHLDTDGVFLCQDCGTPELVMEATSDGFINETYKSTYMSEAVAIMLDADFALVQHPRGEIDRLKVTHKKLMDKGTTTSFVKTTSEMTPKEFLTFVGEIRHECGKAGN